MKKLRKTSLITFVILISVLLFYFWKEYHIRSKTDVITIENVDTENTIKSTIPLKKCIYIYIYIHTVSVKVKGEIDGEFKINGVSLDEGEIDKYIEKRDWYEQSYSIEFVPIL